MRSRIDIKLRLAAHMVALLLLALMLIRADAPGPIDAVRGAAAAAGSAIAERQAAGPPPGDGLNQFFGGPSAPPVAEPPPPTVRPESPAPPDALPLREEPSEIASAASVEPLAAETPPAEKPPEKQAISGETEHGEAGLIEPVPEAAAGPDAPPLVSEAGAGAIISPPAESGSDPAAIGGSGTDDIRAIEPADGEPARPETGVTDPTAETPASEPAPETPGLSRPPEPGESEAENLGSGAGEAGPVLEPLGISAPEMLGDGLFWLSDPEAFSSGLLAVPEVKLVVLLAGNAESGLTLPDGVRTAALPAGIDDIGVDAAERFIGLVEGEGAPALAVAAPDASGAAFFKGAYLLLARKMEPAEVFQALEGELKAAGADADDILHRLSRLAEEAGR